ncbi:MAG: hypothetical protein IT406_00930 [Candidatus Yanofskybacteria bacterium]|nr:hypothetical protein [Candidatus Yanofskybacteria bacterium]
MAYVLMLLAALGVFVWATPAHTAVSERIRQNAHIFDTITASASEVVRSYGSAAADTVREKTMQLLREQLHRTVDEQVR